MRVVSIDGTQRGENQRARIQEFEGERRRVQPELEAWAYEPEAARLESLRQGLKHSRGIDEVQYPVALEQLGRRRRLAPYVWHEGTAATRLESGVPFGREFRVRSFGGVAIKAVDIGINQDAGDGSDGG
jgi:hypothetical protein